MPRIIVLADDRVGQLPGGPEGAYVLLDEHVVPAHLSDGHTASQLIERVGWALIDAEAPRAGFRSSPEP